MDTSPANLFYLWQVPAKPVSVRLSLDVVDRLGATVIEGFKALPRRGLESGGLLLGRERRSGGISLVEINDFEPLECEHAFGPSYLLSAADRQTLVERIAWHKSHGPAVVGFYRGNTRRDFALTMEDVDLMSGWFSRESNVFLLLHANKEAPPTAGFAIWEGKKIRSSVPYGRFEFSAPALAASGLLEVQPVPARRARPRGLELLPALRRWWFALRNRVDWGWIAAAGIVFVTLLFAAALRRDARPALASVPLGLNVAHDGAALRLLWNRDATVVRSATRAVVWIGDGDHQAKLDLDSSQLAGGSIVYWPSSADVNFRMEVFSPSAHGSESVRAVVAPPVPPTAAPEPPAANVSLADSPPALDTPVLDPPASPQERFGDRDRIDTARVAHPPVTPTLRPEPVVLIPENLPPPVPEPPISQPLPQPGGAVLPAALRLPERAPAGADPPMKVEAQLVSESAHPGLFHRLVGPGSEGAGFVPPSPAHRPSLMVPPDLRGRARNVEPIDVRVYVDRTGKVEYAELESEASRVDRDLAALAVFSSRRWQFIPAHVGDRKVPGEVVLRYRFGTP